MVNEAWLPVPGYESYYEVSDLGNVRSKERIVTWKNAHGSYSKTVYHSCSLKKTKVRANCTTYEVVSFSVHSKIRQYPVGRLVLAAFKGLDLSRKDLLACHIDDNGENNALNNLFIGTHADNIHDSMSKGRMNQPGEKSRIAKLTLENVRMIRSMLANGESGISISRKFGISFSTVSGIKTGAKWAKFK